MDEAALIVRPACERSSFRLLGVLVLEAFGVGIDIDYSPAFHAMYIIIHPILCWRRIVQTDSSYSHTA